MLAFHQPIWAAQFCMAVRQEILLLGTAVSACTARVRTDGSAATVFSACPVETPLLPIQMQVLSLVLCAKRSADRYNCVPLQRHCHLHPPCL